MSIERPWGVVDPNSQHQLWSRWIFHVRSGSKHPPYIEVLPAFVRWARLGFGSMGRAKVEEWRKAPLKFRPLARLSRRRGYTLVVEVEGPPAHDLEYRASVQRAFEQDFVENGWGSGAVVSPIEVSILAGDQQDGKPAAQLLVMPSLSMTPQ